VVERRIKMGVGGNMLVQDAEYFSAEFPAAISFILVANLRFEFYGLLREKNPTSWQKSRIEELKKAPACNEPWFVVRLEREGLL
jgi:hypothetical protein